MVRIGQWVTVVGINDDTTEVARVERASGGGKGLRVLLKAWLVPRNK